MYLTTRQRRILEAQLTVYDWTASGLSSRRSVRSSWWGSCAPARRAITSCWRTRQRGLRGEALQTSRTEFANSNLTSIIRHGKYVAVAVAVAVMVVVAVMVGVGVVVSVGVAVAVAVADGVAAGNGVGIDGL